MPTNLEQPIKTFSTEVGAWQGMLDDIKKAESVIYFEQFLFLSYESGQIGSKFANAFIEAANRGVNINLHIDAFGSYELLFNQSFINRFKSAGIKITFYRTTPLSRLVSPLRLFVRNHRKVMLVDSKISWIGGVIIGEEFRDWCDYTWRIDSEVFGKSLHQELENQFDRLDTGDRIIAPFAKVTERIRLVGNSPGIGNRHVYEQICEHILLTNNTVKLVTPYFVPPTRLRHVLEQELADGAEIELYIPAKSDHAIADWARWPYLRKLQEKGLKIMICDGMNHAKIVLTDEWTTFGSTNLDYLSLVFNHELNLDTEDKDLINIVNNQITSWHDNIYNQANDYNELKRLKPKLWQRFVGRIFRYIM